MRLFLQDGNRNRLITALALLLGESSDSPWVVYYNDMGTHIKAIFPNEIDALRFAQSENACDHVKQVPWGGMV